MRIAVVTTSYPSFPGDASGHFVREEALQLAHEGHEVHVIAPGQPGDRGHDPELRLWPVAHGGAFGWPGAVSRITARPWRVAGAAAFVAIARARVRAIAPERVVAHWLVPCAHPVSLLGAPFAAIEAVSHGGDVRALLALPSVVRQRIVCSLLAGQVEFRFVAHALRTALCESLPGPMASAVMARSSVRPAALARVERPRAAAELRRTCTRPILALAAGRVVASKRIELAIEAANLLHDRVHLHVLGDGPHLERLRALDRCGNISFAGQVRHHHALAWIAASDVLVHPSSAEAAPTVVREARALGTPVVACAAGDLERWASRDPGIVLVEPNGRAIASGVREALHHSHFPAPG